MSAVNGVITVWCNGVISNVYTVQCMSAVNGVITVWCNGVISNVYSVCQQLLVSLLYGLGNCDALWACPIHYKVHWRVGRMLGSCKLISAQLLIGSTISELILSSVLWVLEVLSCIL